MVEKKRQITADDLAKDEAFVQEAYRKASPDNFMLFLKGLKIPSAHGPQLFCSCMQSFQVEFFRDFEPSIVAVRDGTLPPIRRFWVERTKKSGKDSDMAACLVWLMAFANRPIKVQVCAANQKQAGIIRGRILELLHYNPWLDELVEVLKYHVVNKAMKETVWTRIEATDSKGGAHGETPDILILNELVHVAKWQAMKDHMNNADGVPRGVVVVCTNAGVKGTTAEAWRKTAMNSKRWGTYIWHKRSPWTNKEDVAEARQRDPIGTEFARLWEGQWVSGTGTAVSEAAISKCFRMKGPQKKPYDGYYYTMGLDLGVSHDHAGLVVVGANPETQRIKVAYVEGFAPSVKNDKGKLEVDLVSVERACWKLWSHYNASTLWYDPAAGGSYMAQRLRMRGVLAKEMTFTPSNLTLMATTFVQAVQNEKLECYPDREGRLRRDFGKFDIAYKPPSKYRLVAVSDEFGHADVGTALIICLPEAVNMIGGFIGDSEVVFFDDQPETPLEEDKDMPDFLRDICDDVERPVRRGRKPKSPLLGTDLVWD